MSTHNHAAANPGAVRHGLSNHGAVLSLAALLCLAAAAKVPPASASDWPTIHADNQRSGYSSTVLTGPFQRLWHRDFHEETIATRVEAIVADGRCFVGTFAGRVRALKVEDGATVWTFQTGGPIGASPHYQNGRLLVGSDDGHLYCLEASSGELLWRYAAAGGVWVAPAVDNQRVYFGDRAGRFHAVSLTDGRPLWTQDTEGMILTPASVTRDGAKIVFASEDMHVYCLDPDGRLLWKSAKLPGLSLRDHAPALWQGLAIVRSNPADGFHVVMDRNGHVLKNIQRAIPLREGEEVLLDRWNDYIVTPGPDRRRAEQDGVVAYLKENPYDETFHALRLSDGTKPWIAPVFYTGGLHNPPTAPTFDPRTDELYLFYRSALTTYLRGVRRYAALGRLEAATGRIDWSWPEDSRQSTWYAMPMIGDETQALSLMGDWLVGTHQGMLAALHTDTLELRTIWDGRDSYAGIFGPGVAPGGFEGARELAAQGFLTGLPHEWHGPDRGIVAIAGQRLFWVAGSQVVCLGGPDAAANHDGGTKPPPPKRSRLTTTAGGNVVGRGQGGFNERLPKHAIDVEDLEPYLAAPPVHAEPRAAPSPAAAKLRAAVREWLDEGPWAPLIVQLGISGEDRYFWRTAETLQILALALPHLEPSLRNAVESRLKKMVLDGAPLLAPVHDGSGRRREPYDFGPGMQSFAERQPRYEANIEDAYALWAYAHYADGWESMRSQLDAARTIFAEFASRPKNFDALRAETPDAAARDAAEHLNARIAGVLGYARLMDHEGNADEGRRARAVLAGLVTERVHHEKADSVLIRPTRTASHALHQAKVPRYVALTPEVAQMLHDFSEEPFAKNLRRLTHDLPVWYHAFGERMIGGENYISPPHLARGLFMALADGRVEDADEMIRYLDQPWGRADLYYIEKCSAVLRARNPDRH